MLRGDGFDKFAIHHDRARGSTSVHHKSIFDCEDFLTGAALLDGSGLVPHT